MKGRLLNALPVMLLLLCGDVLWAWWSSHDITLPDYSANPRHISGDGYVLQYAFAGILNARLVISGNVALPYWVLVVATGAWPLWQGIACIRRHPFAFVSTLSLLLSIAVILLWVRSYRWTDELIRETATSHSDVLAIKR